MDKSNNVFRVGQRHISCWALGSMWLFYGGHPPTPTPSIQLWQPKEGLQFVLTCFLVLICMEHSLLVRTTAFRCGAAEAQGHLWRRCTRWPALAPAGSASCCLGWGGLALTLSFVSALCHYSRCWETVLSSPALNRPAIAVWFVANRVWVTAKRLKLVKSPLW